SGSLSGRTPNCATICWSLWAPSSRSCASLTNMSCRSPVAGLVAQPAARPSTRAIKGSRFLTEPPSRRREGVLHVAPQVERVVDRVRLVVVVEVDVDVEPLLEPLADPVGPRGERLTRIHAAGAVPV